MWQSAIMNQTWNRNSLWLPKLDFPVLAIHYSIMCWLQLEYRYYEDVLFLWLNYLYGLWIEYTSWTFILGRSDKANYRESDDIKFIYFYQMDGVVIWIYAIFWLLSVKIKIWRKLISLTNFNATSSTIIKQLSLYILSRVEAFKWSHLSLLWNAFSDYSCTLYWKSGMVWIFQKSDISCNQLTKVQSFVNWWSNFC